MATCPSCAAENPDRARFCLDCGAAIGSRPPGSTAARKLVTVLFADVVGSTALGERLDPETLRVVLARYFSAARRIVEHHGGTIEKFIGDAVMAVFGIPLLHEDDALRAVRAAVELRDAIGALNAELARERGLQIEFRIGVNTGEVVAGGDGDGSTLATGDAVNVAARLEQSAAAGEILIGDMTFRLVRDFVRAEPIEPILAKGKSEPVAAHRVLQISAAEQPSAGRDQLPFVGRSREMAHLLGAFEDARLERRCYLFTLLGSAGVGKSRLVAEFTARSADQANIVRGRCLPYGVGITYWPIAEIARSAAGTSDIGDAQAVRKRLAELIAGEPEAEHIADLVGCAIGLSADCSSQEEMFWGIRRWLEAQARAKPLVCIIEDIHWAEPTLLDLLEHVAEWTRDAPILLLCTARPELLEARPTWGGGKVNASTQLLEPLSPDMTRELVGALVDGNELPSGLLRRILDTAEGNPLFAEEIVRMLVDDGLLRPDGDAGVWAADQAPESVAMPTSVHAVIAARLDRLPPRERMVAERASVAGRVFERGAVVALVPDLERATLADDLSSLVRKELVQPDRPELTSDDAFRFGHLLIRDTAYEALPKQERAELHERFAGWVKSVVGERLAEYGEIIGYHYEQAYRYRRELGIGDEHSDALAELAAAQLGEAGARAYRRRDQGAAAKLLTRAVALMKPGPARRQTRLTLVAANLDIAQYGDTSANLEQLLAEAEAAGDMPSVWKARLLAHSTRTWSDPAVNLDEGDALVEQALPVFERYDDDLGLAIALSVRADGHLARAHWAAAMADFQRAVPHAAASDPVFEQSLRESVIAAALWGLTPVPELLEIIQRELGRMPSRESIGTGLGALALARAMAGDALQAREDIRTALERRAEIAGPDRAVVFQEGLVEYVLGDLAAAEGALRRSSVNLERGGETAARSTLLAWLALALFDLGRPDGDIQPLIDQCRVLASAGDAVTQAYWRDAQALVEARSGRFEEARSLSAAAVEVAGQTDLLYMKGIVARDRGRIEELARDFGAARTAYETALAHFEQKQDVVDAARMREAVARLG